jgi:(1->4)-alpha-D-glucan 1-alpha-D-glucosylmutase
VNPRLERLAALHGVEPGYHDVFGQWHATTEAAHRALLEAMGVETGGDLDAALEEEERARWAHVLPPAIVSRAAELRSGVRIQLPEASLGRSLAWRVAEEDGDYREERFDAFTLPRREEYRRGDVHAIAFGLALPSDISEGYHRLAILEGGAVVDECALIVVPERCYLPPSIANGARVWGAAAQLYGLRSDRNAGIGDFTDLGACAAFWGERGAALLAINPLHATGLRDPAAASPYSPSSRLFLNTLYIDVEAVEEFRELAAADAKFEAHWREECARLRESPLVEYPRVAAAKKAMFEALHARFATRHLPSGTRRAREFAHFRESRGPALRRHALHEALAEFHSLPWQSWPAEHRDPHGEAVRRFAVEHEDRVGLHEYLQWIADRQLAAAQSRCREAGMAIGLYTDLAISIGNDGSEAWANQRLYALGVGVGAPPDEFNIQGQDWGLPPLVPRRLREAGYTPFIATLRANMARSGALRIDHVMGLARLYWVPHGMSPASGGYVRYPIEDMLGIVALESQRHACLVIGEDLGTVDEEFRAKMAAACVLSYRLLLFERDASAFKAAASYPRNALVAWSTHDLPTLAGWWEARDLQERGALGLIGRAELPAALEERRRSRVALLEALAREGVAPAGGPRTAEDPFDEDLALAVHGFIARTPSAVMVVQMEDVLGLVDQANLPGTVDQHPNWRRKLPVTLEALERDARVRRLARLLAPSRGQRARAHGAIPESLARAPIPRATYRLQLHGEFTFRDATALVPYLAALGVSHVYCSPYLRARKGSKHGYDIIDHGELNPEIGTREDFDAFVAQLKAHHMSQVMDIVPNHMGVLSADNAWWLDVLENGPASVCADYFDIDWTPPAEHLAHRVLLPVLADHYGIELAAGRLVLDFDPAAGAFAVRYYEHHLPIDPREYPRILARGVRTIEGRGLALAHHTQALRSIAEAFERLPGREARGRAQLDERNLGKEIAKRRLGSLARASPEVSQAIASALAAFNGHPGEPDSFDALHELLERQAFRVAYWRVAQDEINYRRFFDINDLAALRQENDAVFRLTHRLVVELVNSGAVEALRVDHPDGLFDPKEYFRKLQEACARPVYLVIEKIVAPFENVPRDWPVHGTTGYRFANVVNGIFVDPAAESRITRTYHNFIGSDQSYEETTRVSRRLVLRSALASELTVLTSRLARIAKADRSTRDFTFTTLRDGLADVLAAFPVYRTYIDDDVHSEDRRYIEWAVTRARSESLAADVSVFDFIRDALTRDLPARTPALAAQVRQLARKFQQVSAPVMAKGVEDTAFYRYVRLASLNDVGAEPSEFGFPVARFHRASAHRARYWPHTMLATSTHDNKRSEDVRARIDALSEMPAGWRLQLQKWGRMNEGRKTLVEDVPAPSRNDEYLLYQVLLGSMPPNADRAGLATFRDRIVAYMQKAGREAKLRTSWANVNQAYEEATEAFVRALLDDAHPNPFLDDFRAALAPVAWLGGINSIAMAAIKLTSPGVPDIYQGNETLDFSLVDPDNRRPVDYALRRQMLEELQALGYEPSAAAISEIFADPNQGRAKMYVVSRLLALRREREALFRLGGYTPLRVTGKWARNVVAFARRHDDGIVATIAPRLTSALGLKPGMMPIGEVWGDTKVLLPFLAEGAKLRDAVTGTSHRLEGTSLAISALLANAPVAVLSA